MLFTDTLWSFENNKTVKQFFESMDMLGYTRSRYALSADYLYIADFKNPSTMDYLFEKKVDEKSLSLKAIIILADFRDGFGTRHHVEATDIDALIGNQRGAEHKLLVSDESSKRHTKVIYFNHD